MTINGFLLFFFYVVAGLLGYIVYLLTVYLTASLICEAINRSKIRFLSEISKTFVLDKSKSGDNEKTKTLERVIADLKKNGNRLN